MIRVFEIRNHFRSFLICTSAIIFGYFKNRASIEDSIVGIGFGLLWCPGTVEELACVVTLSVEGSLLAIHVLLAISWSVKRTSMLFHL